MVQSGCHCFLKVPYKSFEELINRIIMNLQNFFKITYTYHLQVTNVFCISGRTNILVYETVVRLPLILSVSEQFFSRSKRRLLVGSFFLPLFCCPKGVTKRISEDLRISVWQVTRHIHGTCQCRKFVAQKAL